MKNTNPMYLVITILFCSCAGSLQCSSPHTFLDESKLSQLLHPAGSSYPYNFPELEYQATEQGLIFEHTTQDETATLNIYSFQEIFAGPIVRGHVSYRHGKLKAVNLGFDFNEQDRDAILAAFLHVIRPDVVENSLNGISISDMAPSEPVNYITYVGMGNGDYYSPNTAFPSLHENEYHVHILIKKSSTSISYNYD